MARKVNVLTESIEQRCAAEAKLRLEKAAILPLGAERARLEREAWVLLNAMQLNSFFSMGEAKSA